jgi:hypothetical protein
LPTARCAELLLRLEVAGPYRGCAKFTTQRVDRGVVGHRANRRVTDFGGLGGVPGLYCAVEVASVEEVGGDKKSPGLSRGK